MVRSQEKSFCEGAKRLRQFRKRSARYALDCFATLAERSILLLSLAAITACGVQGDIKRPSEMSEKEKQEAWF